MAVRVRLGFALIAALALSAVLASTGSATARVNVTPTLYVLYAMDCTFSIQDDSGKTINAIAPGNYQVDVRTPLAFGTVPLTGVSDMTACHGSPQFQLTGPGVNLFTTMTAGCEADKTFPETFAPGASYVAQDLNQPSVAHASFTTLTSGSAGSTSVSYGGGKGTGQLSQDVVGSLNTTAKGTLTATVSTDGKLTLLSNGKPVTSLGTPGLYRFTISDRTSKGSFVILGPSSTSATNLTGVKFVGSKTVTVRLKAGRWTYYSNLRNVHYLTVA
jgi:hypothetical protein